ncbi:MAG: cyclase family protein [Gammaproteobacteria bacterium]
MKKFPFRLIDLTHTLHSSIPTWGGGCGFKHDMAKDYEPDSPWKFRTYKIAMEEGIGTHIDAPAHCIPASKYIDDIPLDTLIAPCVVIDVSNKADETYRVSAQDIDTFENIHGAIHPGTFVIVRTGWDRFWDEPAKYHNNLMFPCLTESTAQLLVQKNIVGLGIDTLSPDRPEHGYPVHKIILGANKYIVENVANSAQLPVVGCFSFSVPLKIYQGTEAPIRLIGLVPIENKQHISAL